jgi:hypothetical protein
MITVCGTSTIVSEVNVPQTVIFVARTLARRLAKRIVIAPDRIEMFPALAEGVELIRSEDYIQTGHICLEFVTFARNPPGPTWSAWRCPSAAA